MAYGYFGTMRVQPGKREDVLAILLSASDSLSAHGCHAYVVGTAEDPDVICVSELWDSKEAHAASLKLPAVQAAIAKGRPLIAGFGTRAEFTPVAKTGA